MTAKPAHTRVPIATPGDVGEARRTATLLCRTLGLDQTDAGRAALVVTEAATNVHKHAGHGELLLRPLTGLEGSGLEVIALDRGPGMDVERCMRDGYSTAGSPGSGLGAISRMSNLLDIYAGPSGTALFSRVLGGAVQPVPACPLEVGGVSVAVAGETECGDAWAELAGPDRTRILVADGLGHGPLAAKASVEAARVFHERTHDPLHVLLEIMHPALLPTRGAAVSVADIEPGSGKVRFAGAGNVAGALVTAAGHRGMLTQNGTVGVEMRRVQSFDYDWPASPGSLLVMHSDGIGSRWDLGKYPGLHRHRPTTIAAVLYRDYTRGRDDTTVVVAARNSGAAP